MKKLLVVILGALFVFSFAASAFAIHAEIPSETQAVVAKGATQITIGGDIRTRGWYRSNLGSSNVPAKANDAAYYDQRIRLSVDAKISPNVEGMIELESGIGQDYTYKWGNFGSKPQAGSDGTRGLGFLQAWILYSGSGLFGFPSGVKIGHMPLYLGNKEFFDHAQFGDDAIVFFMLPTKELEIDLLTIKFAGDGSPSSIPQFGITDASGSAFDNTDDLDGYVGVLTYKLDDKNTLGLNYTYLNQSDLGFSHQNLGFVANGNISGLGYNFTADIQFGKVFDGQSNEGDFGGWSIIAGVNYMIDPVNLRAKFGYGSGDDNPNDNDQDQFVTYLNLDPNYTFVYDYSAVTAAGRTHTGISNTTYYNLGIDADLMKDLKASLDGYLLYASDTPNGISDKIGWEVDAKVKYNIAKNLTYQVDAGFLFADDFYKDTYNLNDNKTATVLRHLIQLSF